MEGDLHLTDGPPSTAPDAPMGAASVSDLEALRRAIEGHGLSAYEARVLVAVLQLGTGTATQLAAVCGVARPNVHAALVDLNAKNLVARVPGKVTEWVSPGREQVLERLHAHQAARLDAMRAQLEASNREAREALDRLSPEAPAAALPYVHVLRGGGPGLAAYLRLLGEATTEVLVFNQPPYGGEVRIHPAVMEMLARKVPTRALYQAAEIGDPEAEAHRQTYAAYHAAGVQGRITDEVPIKLAVFDRRVAIIGLDDPFLPGATAPLDLLIEHRGFAIFAADGFEQRWAAARPYPDDAGHGSEHEAVSFEGHAGAVVGER